MHIRDFISNSIRCEIFNDFSETFPCRFRIFYMDHYNNKYMKRNILLMVVLLLISGTIWADAIEKYNKNDSLQLLKFLKQSDNSIELFEGASNWETNPNWIEKVSFVTWNIDNDENRIETIDFGNLPLFLSGVLDMSDCSHLKKVKLPNCQLTSVNFSNCEKLETVILSGNKISSADFSSCNSLENIELNSNSLMLSGIKFPNQMSARCDISDQTINTTDCSIEIMNDEPCIMFNFIFDTGKELDLEFKWSAANREITPLLEKNFLENTKKGSIFYFRIKDLLEMGTEFEPEMDVLAHGLACQVKVAEINYEATYVYNAAGRFSVNLKGLKNQIIAEDSDQGAPYLNEVQPFSVFIKTIDKKIFEIPFNFIHDSRFYSKSLPKGDYIISVAWPGYLSSYYHENDEKLVTVWEEASVVPISSGDSLIDISLFPEREFVTPGTITISGNILLEDMSGSSVKAQVPTNATGSLFSKNAVKQSGSDVYTLVKTIAITDGYYEFTGLPQGEYKVTIEIAGYEKKGSIELVTGSEKTEYPDNDFIVRIDDKIIKPKGVPTAVAELFMPEAQLIVYPNPAIDLVRIEGLDGTSIIKVVNILGQTVRTWNSASSEFEFNIRDLPTGMYVIRIDSNGRIITRKLIKK